MGIFQSKEIKNTYSFNGDSFSVSIKGGKAALNKQVSNGDTITIIFQNMFDFQDDAKKYIKSNRFINDLNKNIMTPMTGVASEYGLPISESVLENTTWKVTGKPKIIKHRHVEIKVLVKSKSKETSTPFGEVAAFIAGCIAWHVKSGSIPVKSKSSAESISIEKIELAKT